MDGPGRDGRAFTRPPHDGRLHGRWGPVVSLHGRAFTRPPRERPVGPAVPARFNPRPRFHPAATHHPRFRPLGPDVSIHGRAFTRPPRAAARPALAGCTVSIHGRAFTRPPRAARFSTAPAKCFNPRPSFHPAATCRSLEPAPGPCC